MIRISLKKYLNIFSEYSGLRCEKDPCSTHSCSGGGYCEFQEHRAVCICDKGNFVKYRLVQSMTAKTEALVRFNPQSIHDLCQYVYVKMVIREIIVNQVLALQGLVKTAIRPNSLKII